MPDLPVHHQLQELTQTHVHCILCRPLLLPSVFGRCFFVLLSLLRLNLALLILRWERVSGPGRQGVCLGLCEP